MEIFNNSYTIIRGIFFLQKWVSCYVVVRWPHLSLYGLNFFVINDPTSFRTLADPLSFLRSLCFYKGNSVFVQMLNFPTVFTSIPRMLLVRHSVRAGEI